MHMYMSHVMSRVVRWREVLHVHVCLREWGRAGVRAVLIEGANEAEVAAAGVTGGRKRKRVAEREAVRMTR
eukprot:6246891-Prymnesium_polylepis.1